MNEPVNLEIFLTKGIPILLKKVRTIYCMMVQRVGLKR